MKNSIKTEIYQRKCTIPVRCVVHFGPKLCIFYSLRHIEHQRSTQSRQLYITICRMQCKSVRMPNVDASH